MAISSLNYNGGWLMTTDYYIRAQYLKVIGAAYLNFSPVFVSLDFEVCSTSVPYGANLIYKKISEN